MKKGIVFLVLFLGLPVLAEVVTLDKDSEIFMDEAGLYRYKRAEDVYQKNCQDSSTEEIKKRCLAAEKAVWERGKTPEEIKKQGSLFTGKIKVPSIKGDSYFYVKNGKKGEPIRLLLKRYYFENDSLHDIKTEAPFTGEIVIGGVESLSADEDAPRYIAQQKYENGRPIGNPELILIKE
ncbi:MAG: hypothetical protein ACI4OR_01010 [Alphaproteobacteria bacterium]